jgi:hypothetical protein
MSNPLEPVIDLVANLQKALSAQIEVNQSLMARISKLEEHSVMTGDVVLKLLKDQHGVDACGRHCACKAGEM